LGAIQPINWSAASKGAGMEYQELLKLVQQRRSIRAFTDEPVPDELVDQVIEAGRWAPSGTNSQPWEFVVVRDQAMKDRIAGLVKPLLYLAHEAEMTRPEDMRWPSAARPVEDPFWKNTPVLIVVCGDQRTKKSYPLFAQLSRGDSIFVSSLASAFLYMTLAATSLGLGSHWASATSHPSVMPLIMEALGIPDDFFIYDMMGLCYPAAQPKPRIVRTRADFVHYGRYDQSKSRTDAQVREFLVSLRK
jgi:nitroreductase